MSRHDAKKILRLKKTSKSFRKNDSYFTPPLVVVNGCSDEDEWMIRKAATRTLFAEKIERGTLEIAVVTAREMTKLHEQWLDKSTPTDVLTFDLRARPRK